MPLDGDEVDDDDERDMLCIPLTLWVNYAGFSPGLPVCEDAIAMLIPWQTHGRRMAIAWQTHGKRVANA